ncbi:MAG: FAD-binding protein [Alphaproteobacteria bacterium]|jgi:electron transfer flavoprotein alpha subunit|tara:strand:- start:1748 stop:2686 length:939 start_codon:yes stop_codon:yes gene_type:complete
MKVLVIVEHNNKTIKPSTFSTITAGSQICDDVNALIIGHKLQGAVDELKKADNLKKILLIDKEGLDNPIAENLSSHIIEFLKDNDQYTHILTPSSTFGKNLSPKIATKLDVQQISDIIKIFDPDTFERPIYAGNAIAKVKSTEKMKVLTVRPTCFELCGLSSEVEVENLNLKNIDLSSVSFVAYDESKSDRPELTSAKVIISGGRGMQNGDNFKLLEGIADKLGAAMGASRAAVDAGFVPNDWQVGQTGKIVAPDLYVAVGISGAIQHIAGIKDSKVIASINKDEEAPIFKFSDYGLVADLFQILPELEKKL